MTDPRLRPIAAGVHAWIGAGGDSNAGAVETPHGVLVVDAQQSRALGEAISRCVASTHRRAIRAAVNTHYHLDHVAGNVAFGEVPIVGHLETVRALERELGPHAGEAVTVTDVPRKIRLFFGANFEELVPPQSAPGSFERVGGDTPMAIVPPTEGFADRLEFRLSADVLHLSISGPRIARAISSSGSNGRASSFSAICFFMAGFRGLAIATSTAGSRRSIAF